MNTRYRLAKRGAIYCIHNFKFENQTKPKYCLLLEDIYNFAESLIVVLTTSNMEDEYEKTTIKAHVKGINGATLIDLYNIHDLPVDILLDESLSKYIGMLPKEKMDEVDNKLKYLKINHDLWIRMQPNKEPY